jgi:hypothetical protein
MHATETPCPKVTASQKPPFGCQDGTLTFGQNYWHDGLEEQQVGGLVSAVWTQKSGYIVDQQTYFYDCRNCIVDPKHGNLSCVAGSHGLLCSQCNAGYFKHKSSGNCLECGDWAAVQISLVSCLSFLVIVLAFIWWWHRPGCIALKASMTSKALKGRVGLAMKRVFRSLYSEKVKIKFFIGFYQISALLHSSYGVPYPFIYLQLMDQIDFFSVDFVRATPGPCVFGSGYTFATKVYSTGCVIIAIYVGVAVCVCKRHRSWAQKGISWLPTLIFLVYPSFSALFFRALKCQTIDGNDYLAEDLSVLCTGVAHRFLWNFSLAFILVWAFGLPALAFGLLWPVRAELQKGSDIATGAQQHLKDFFADFRPSMWFFGIAEYITKFLVIGIIPALQPDVMGAVVALLVVNCYLALLLVLAPYAKTTDNFLVVCLNALLSIVMLVSALLKMDAAYLSQDAAAGFDTDTAVYLLVTSNVFVILMTGVSYIASVWHSEHSNNRGRAAETELEEVLRVDLGTEGGSGSYEQLTDRGTEHKRARWVSSSRACATSNMAPVLAHEQPTAMFTMQSGDVSKHVVGNPYIGVVCENGEPTPDQQWIVHSRSAASGPGTVTLAPVRTMQSGNVSKHPVGCEFAGIVRESGVPIPHQRWVVHSRSAANGPGVLTLIPAPVEEELPRFDPLTAAPLNNAARRVGCLSPKSHAEDEGSKA